MFVVIFRSVSDTPGTATSPFYVFVLLNSFYCSNFTSILLRFGLRNRSSESSEIDLSLRRKHDLHKNHVSKSRVGSGCIFGPFRVDFMIWDGLGLDLRGFGICREVLEADLGILRSSQGDSGIGFRCSWRL